MNLIRFMQSTADSVSISGLRFIPEIILLYTVESVRPEGWGGVHLR